MPPFDAIVAKTVQPCYNRQELGIDEEEVIDSMNQKLLRALCALLLGMMLSVPALADVLPEAQVVAAERAIAVSSVTLNAQSIGIALGKTYRFKATVLPQNAKNKEITWSLVSHNPPTAPNKASSFDPKTGVFTAGTALGEQLTLTAKTKNGKLATAKIKVKLVSVSSVKFSKSKATAAMGKTYDLKKVLTVTPKAAADPSIKWTSADDKIASVNDQGIMTAHEGGTVKITATSISNPDKKASCTISVKYTKVKTVTLNATNITVNPGERKAVTAVIAPANAHYKQLKWQSSNEAVATVNQQGDIVAIAPGVATITVTSIKDGATDKLKFRVRGGDMQVIKLSAIGDVMLGGDKRRVPKADDPIGDKKTSYQRFKDIFDKHGAAYFFANVKGTLKDDDITIANIEGVLTSATAHAKKNIVISGAPKYREILRDSGVDIASIVNNHANDFGSKGFSDTIANLRTAGLKVVRSGYAYVATVKGVKMGFVSFMTPADPSAVASAIKQLKQTNKCKIVVVSIHWARSPEWTSKITADERKLARHAIVSGADLVLGHHKHMTSGIERYKGKMIAYDLGNFIGMLAHKDKSGKYFTKDSMIYQQRFNVFSDGYVEVVDPNIIPTMNSETTDSFTGQAHLATGEDHARILNDIAARSPANSRDLVKHISGN